jgi:hypothetical protein
MRVSRHVPLFALLGLAIAVPALAQTGLVKPGEPIPAACTAKDVTGDRNQRASDLYKTGKLASENLEREKAILYYTDAYRADCTGHRVLLRIAEQWELIGNKAESLRYTEAYLDRASPTDNERDAANVRRDRLKRDLAAAPPASSTAAPTATVVPTATTTAAPTTTATPTAVPTATDDTGMHPRGHTALPWVFVGVGGAALITGGVLAIVGSGKVSTADKNCDPATPGGRDCQNTGAVSSGNSGRTLETVGVPVGIVGLAALATGLIWHFGENTTVLVPNAATHVMPAVAPGYAGLSWGGTF